MTGLGARVGAAGSRTMVVGEPGIGKSAVLDYLVQENLGSRALFRTQPREGLATPFCGIRDLLATADWTKEEGAAASNGTEPRGRSEYASALRAALRRDPHDGVLIVVDDWQWMDSKSRLLIEQALQDRAFRDHVSILASRRLDGSSEDLSVQPLFRASDVFGLGPLAPDFVTEIIRDGARSHLDPDVVRSIVRSSRGNPLLALELTVSADDQDPRRETPTSFSAAMGDRVRALDPELQLLIGTLGIMGRTRASDVAILCSDAGHIIARGLEAGVVRQQGDDLVVSDRLLASAAVGLLTDDRRRQMHAILANSSLPELDRAEHSDDATPAGVHEVLAQTLEAQAARARSAGRPETALRLLRRSLARTRRTDAAFRARAIMAAEDAFLGADSGAVLNLLSEVDFDRVGTEELDRAIPLLASALHRAAGPAAVRRRLRSLEAMLPDGIGRVIVSIQLMTCGEERPDPDSDSKVAVLAAVVSEETAPHSWRHAQQWLARRYQEHGHGLDEARIAALGGRSDQDLPLRDSADRLVAFTAYQSDDLNRSRGSLLGIVRAAKIDGEHYLTVEALAHLSMVELLAGHTQRAEPHLKEAEAGARRLVDVPAALRQARAMMALRRGDRESVRTAAEDALGPSLTIRGDLLGHGLLGLDAAFSGEWDLALDELLKARSAAERWGIREPGRRLWIDVTLARALVVHGELPAAEEIAKRLEATVNATRLNALGQAHRIVGLVRDAQGRNEDALTYLRRAVHEVERGGFRPELARTRKELADALRAVNLEAEADHQLELAQQEAVRVQDPRILAEMEDAVQQVQHARRTMVLTRSEERVAGRAAGGATNRQIAAELFLSVRTVETHLASAYRKLGVKSRTQLALVLLEVAGIGQG